MEPDEGAVFPCVLRIVKDSWCVKYMDPIVLIVDVVGGIAKVGTPICIPSRDFINIGRITSIKMNQKVLGFAKEGVRCLMVEITGANAEEPQKMFGLNFYEEDELVSCISRESIDSLKAKYLDTMSSNDINLLLKLKAIVKIN